MVARKKGSPKRCVFRSRRATKSDEDFEKTMYCARCGGEVEYVHESGGMLFYKCTDCGRMYASDDYLEGEDDLEPYLVV